MFLSDFLNACSYGMYISLIFFVSIALIKRIDEENELPLRLNPLYGLLTFPAGICSYYFIGEASCNAVACGAAFTLVMAYCDMHTMKLYTIFSVIFGLLGMVLIFQNKGLNDFLPGMLLYTTIVMLSYFLKAINSGDVELMLAISPYVYLIGKEIKINSLTVLCLFFWASLLFCLMIYLKKYLKTKQKIVPFAPSVCTAYMSLILLCMIMKG